MRMPTADFAEADSKGDFVLLLEDLRARGCGEWEEEVAFSAPPVNTIMSSGAPRGPSGGQPQDVAEAEVARFE